MYTSILVPLDGSSLSERALPVALGLARRSEARVELFHAHDFLPPATGAPAFETRFDHEAAAKMGASLDALARRLTLDTGLDVRVVMRDGPPAASVLDYTVTSGTDLIVMATHGHGGLGRTWFGNVASKVVRRASVPVMLIRPRSGDSSFAHWSGFRRILLPLDGSEAAETALDHAAVLGTPGDTTLTLVRVVVPRFLAIPPLNTVSVPLDVHESETREERAAVEYLERARAQLCAAGFETTVDVLVAMEIPDALLAYARSHDADLIALAARPRATLSEIVFGSVAQTLIHHAAVPLLVCHPRGIPAADPTAASGTPAAHMGL